MGLVGSAGMGAQGGGDFGVFVGETDGGDYKTGLYWTGTGSLTTSGGAEMGMLIGYANSSVDNMRGTTLGQNFGLDTPVVDFFSGRMRLVVREAEYLMFKLLSVFLHRCLQ